MTDSGFSMADFSSPEEYDFSWKIIMDPGKSCEKTRKLAIKNEKMQWRNPLHPGEGHFLKKVVTEPTVFPGRSARNRNGCMKTEGEGGRAAFRTEKPGL